MNSFVSKYIKKWCLFHAIDCYLCNNSVSKKVYNLKYCLKKMLTIIWDFSNLWYFCNSDKDHWSQITIISMIIMKKCKILQQLSKCNIETGSEQIVFGKWHQKVARYRVATNLQLVHFSSVQSLSHVRLFVTPWTAACQAFPPITKSRSLNSCSLSRWYHPTISSSVVPISSCLQSFLASGSFQMSHLFTSGG